MVLYQLLLVASTGNFLCFLNWLARHARTPVLAPTLSVSCEPPPALHSDKVRQASSAKSARRRSDSSKGAAPSMA